MRACVIAALLSLSLPGFVRAQSMADDQVPISFTLSAKPYTLAAGSNATGGGVLGRRSSGSALGIDSVANWSSYFYYQGLDSNGFTQFTWQYTMVGNAPFGQGHDQDWEGETTWIGAPVIPVSLDLRNFDGSPRFVGSHRLISDAKQFVAPVLNSPVFSKTFYTSSEDSTQYTTLSSGPNSFINPTMTGTPCCARVLGRPGPWCSSAARIASPSTPTAPAAPLF